MRVFRNLLTSMIFEDLEPGGLMYVQTRSGLDDRQRCLYTADEFAQRPCRSGNGLTLIREELR